MKTTANTDTSGAEFATAVAKLWPHREHESNAVVGSAAGSGCIVGVSSI